MTKRELAKFIRDQQEKQKLYEEDRMIYRANVGLSNQTMGRGKVLAGIR